MGASRSKRSTGGASATVDSTAGSQPLTCQLFNGGPNAQPERVGEEVEGLFGLDRAWAVISLPKCEARTPQRTHQSIEVR